MYQVSTLMWEMRLLKLQALDPFQIFPSLQFPQIPLIQKCMCLRGQEAHQKSHQRLILNPNIHNFSSLILIGIQWCPRNPLGKVNSQPSIFHQDLRFMWEMKSWLIVGCKKKPLENVPWSGLSEGNPGLTLHQSDELYSSSPLVHKEKFTGSHHPYASKPRTGYASSSREKIVDDEEENMSPTQSETNDEPRRENFTAHDQGTQSNSEFTHPQMPLAQSMLYQSKMRQKRNQA
ncbi:hypothetical protein O181_016566 [Austropuccinia psidii MF-1]|uniref:Uncharacterized protein n=1 Tax=Austropuccinia psidii MF-1 TaxID=1389203 RepID=A0A9Q3C1Y3_9BASI|nr:hypothetical protein [Austropuccinia psidii MF-1]